jgi:hypothetical protein
VTPADVDGAVRLGAWWLDRDLLDEIGSALRTRLATSHAAEPAAAGEDVETVRRWIVDLLASAGAPRDAGVADAVIGRLDGEGGLVREGAFVRLGSHRSDAGEDGPRLVEVVRRAEPTPPSIAELRASGFSGRVVDAAVRSGGLVRISPDLVLTRELVERAEAAVREAGDAGITVSALRRARYTRKYAIRCSSTRSDGVTSLGRSPFAEDPRRRGALVDSAHLNEERDLHGRPSGPARRPRRACLPSSPKTSTRRSLAPFATLG